MVFLDIFLIVLPENIQPTCRTRVFLEGPYLANRLHLERANIDSVNNMDWIVITGKKNKTINMFYSLLSTGSASVNVALASNSGFLGGAL